MHIDSPQWKAFDSVRKLELHVFDVLPMKNRCEHLVLESRQNIPALIVSWRNRRSAELRSVGYRGFDSERRAGSVPDNIFRNAPQSEMVSP